MLRMTVLRAIGGTLLLSLLTLTTFAQLLTFDQLLTLRSKDVQFVDDFLTLKGWKFSHSEKETENTYGEAVWAFDKSFIADATARGWLTLRYSEGYPTRIVYQVHDKAYYLAVKNRITQLGMKLTHSSIEDNGIKAIYYGKNYAVEVESSSSESKEAPAYVIRLFTKLDHITANLEEFTSSDSDETLYTGQLVGDKGFLWSSENLVEAQLVYEIPSGSKIAVIREGKEMNEAIVNGHRGFVRKAVISRQLN